MSLGREGVPAIDWGAGMLQTLDLTTQDRADSSSELSRPIVQPSTNPIAMNRLLPHFVQVIWCAVILLFILELAFLVYYWEHPNAAPLQVFRNFDQTVAEMIWRSQIRP